MHWLWSQVCKICKINFNSRHMTRSERECWRSSKCCSTRAQASAAEHKHKTLDSPSQPRTDPEPSKQYSDSFHLISFKSQQQDSENMSYLRVFQLEFQGGAFLYLLFRIPTSDRPRFLWRKAWYKKNTCSGACVSGCSGHLFCLKSVIRDCSSTFAAQ